MHMQLSRPPSLRGQIDEPLRLIGQPHIRPGLHLEGRAKPRIFGAALDVQGVLTGIQLHVGRARRNEMVEPKGQLPRPLRLAGRVLEVDAAWDRLCTLLVADRNLHLDAAGESRGADGEQQEKRMNCSVGWSVDHQEDSGPNAPLAPCFPWTFDTAV